MYANSNQRCAVVPLTEDTQDISAKQFQKPIEGKSRIYIVRSSISVRRQISKVLLDGQPAADIAPYTYIAIDVTPGSHRIKARADKDVEIQLNVAPGKLYYVELGLGLLFNTVSAKLEMLDEKEGQSAVLESRRAISLFDTQ